MGNTYHPTALGEAAAATVRDNLRRLRKANRHSLATFTAAINATGHPTTTACVGAHERGTRRMTINHLKTYADTYGIPVGALFSAEQPETVQALTARLLAGRQ